jgi:phosphate transport system substrate-binding protein
VKGLKLLIAASAALVLLLGVAACGDEDESSASSGGELSGSIRIDGSSTVAPLSEAVAAQFQEENPDVQVTVGTAGTGGGFERFCAGETDISDASRQVEPEEEELCQEGNVEFEEVTVANDALSVVVNPDNPVTCMSPDQLAEIYGPEADATSWSDVPDLDAEYDETLDIFSPGADSGTFDYFTEAVNGEEGAQRSQGINVVGEDDNATVTGVAGSPGGIGYFGFSFFSENQDQLKALEIENEDGDCVAPSEETAQDGSYNPLGRQLYIYPSTEALQRPEVQAFVEYYAETANEVIPQVGFIPLTEEQLQKSQETVQEVSSGGASGGGSGEPSGGGSGQ